MNLRKLVMVLIGIVFVVVFVIQPPFVSAEGHSVEGYLWNGTFGQPVGPGHELVLEVLEPPIPGHTQHSVTDLSGGFLFNNLPTGAVRYLITVLFDQVTYRFDLSEDSRTDPVKFTVYQRTDNISEVEISDETLTIMSVDSSLSRINVLHVAQIENTGDSTFVNEPEGDNPMNLLRFALPDETTDLDVRTSLTGGHLIQVDRGFALTTPIPPGKHDLLATYRVPYFGTSWDHSARLPLGSKKFRLLVPEGLANVETDSLSGRGAMDIGDTTYLVFESADNMVGDRIRFKLADMPRPPISRRVEQFFDKTYVQLGLAPVILGTFTLLVLIYFGITGIRFTWGRRNTLHSNDGELEYQRLLDLLVALDTEFESSAIDESTYYMARERLKERMVAIKLANLSRER